LFTSLALNLNDEVLFLDIKNLKKEFPMYKKLLIAAATSMFALSAFAVDTANIEKSYELKNGRTVYIFNDGKMGMEDKEGRPVMGTEGNVMETKDGQRIIMMGNEVWRVEGLNNPG